MSCCTNCFQDSEIHDIIKSSKIIGNCDFCLAKDVFIYDISVVPNPISNLIISLLDTYSVSEGTDAKFLKESLCDDWGVFSKDIDTEIIQKLIQSLCINAYPENDDLYTKKVIIPATFDQQYLNEFGIVRGHSWKEFSNSIKHENRFHSEMFNTNTFASFLSIIAKKYRSGSQFFRARISPDKKGFGVEEMGAPPKEKRSMGRINPEGISILYLSSDRKTVLNEVRATAFDYVTIGEFQLKEDMTVVNLSGILSVSPFLYEGELEKYAVNRKVFQEIALELAKPLRRSDSHLEYLPTQYISEFIKSQKYDGVEYASTLREGGLNLAVFDEKSFECVNVQTLEVSKISYETDPQV